MKQTQRNLKATKLSQEAFTFVQNNSNERFVRSMKLQNAWEAVASPQALKHTDNVVFSTKSKTPCILVYVDSSHWAAELGTQKELYRILLQRETGWEVTDIKFLITRKTAFKKFFQRHRAAKQNNNKQSVAVPLDENEERYARELVSLVKDEKLQKQLYKAIKADFEWKKGKEGLKLS
jgi:hypothetical protein